MATVVVRGTGGGRGDWVQRRRGVGRGQPLVCLGTRNRTDDLRLKVNTSVLTLVAIESSSGLPIFGYIIRRGIKGIYIFQNINKRSFIDCYKRVVADVVNGWS